MSANGERLISARDLRAFRQKWDKLASAAGGYGSNPDLATAQSAAAYRTAASAIRDSIAKAFPDIADANSEYALWSDVRDAAGDALRTARTRGNTTSSAGKLLNAAAAFGLGDTLYNIATSRPAGVPAAFMALKAAHRLASTTLTRQAGAVLLNRVAGLLERGQLNEAQALVAQAAAVAGASANQIQQRKSKPPGASATPATGAGGGGRAALSPPPPPVENALVGAMSPPPPEPFQLGGGEPESFSDAMSRVDLADVPSPAGRAVAALRSGQQFADDHALGMGGGDGFVHPADFNPIESVRSMIPTRDDWWWKVPMMAAPFALQARWKTSTPPRSLKAVERYRERPDWSRAPGGREVHEPIASRDHVYHATSPGAFEGIVDAGRIEPFDADDTSGVSVSRRPGIETMRENAVLLAIDPRKMPRSRPFVAWPKGSPAEAVLQYELPEAAKAAGDPLGEQYLAKVQQGDTAGAEAIFEQLQAKYSHAPGVSQVDPHFEAELRTFGEPIPTSAIRKVIVTRKPDPGELGFPPPRAWDLEKIRRTAEEQGWPLKMVQNPDELVTLRAKTRRKTRAGASSPPPEPPQLAPAAASQPPMVPQDFPAGLLERFATEHGLSIDEARRHLLLQGYSITGGKQ
jgi:hypothetical protein